MTSDPQADPALGGFFKKYGATRARTDGQPDNWFLLDSIDLYRRMLSSGRMVDGQTPLGDRARAALQVSLDKLIDKARRRGLVVPPEPGQP